MKATKVWSPGGYMPGPVNSLVGKDETLYSPTNGRAQLVEKGKVGVDNQPSSIREDDDNIILGNDRNWNTGNKISQEAKPITLQLMRYNKIEDKISNLQKKSNLDSLSKQTQKLNTDMLSRAKQPLLDGLDRLSQIQKTQHDIEDYTHTMNKFAKGKEYAPGHIPQWWPLAGNMIGAGASALKLSHWLANRPETTDIYAANRYAPQALRTLNSARINPYGIMQRLQLADRNAAYELANNGGYSGGQRQANRTALALGNQRNIANALESAQEKNIGFRNAAAQAMLQAGESDAARRQAANQYRFDQYVRSHGARIKGIESSLADLAKFGQQYWADKIKYKQYADTLGLYQQDVNNRKEALNAMLGGSKTTTTPTANSVQSAPSIGKIFQPSNLHFTYPSIYNYTPKDKIWYRDYNQILNQNRKILDNAYLQEAYNKQLHGDNGSEFMNFMVRDNFSLPTNNIYLKSLNDYEQIAGTDDMEMMARKPSTFSGFFPYGFDVTKLRNNVNNLRY